MISITNCYIRCNLLRFTYYSVTVQRRKSSKKERLCLLVVWVTRNSSSRWIKNSTVDAFIGSTVSNAIGWNVEAVGRAPYLAAFSWRLFQQLQRPLAEVADALMYDSTNVVRTVTSYAIGSHSAIGLQTGSSRRYSSPRESPGGSFIVGISTKERAWETSVQRTGAPWFLGALYGATQNFRQEIIGLLEVSLLLDPEYGMLYLQNYDTTSALDFLGANWSRICLSRALNHGALWHIVFLLLRNILTYLLTYIVMYTTKSIL